MKLLILADIHANLTAFRAVLNKVPVNRIDCCALLGDLIDYGMRPNETLQAVKEIPCRLLCNLWGNHEKAVMDQNSERFSSQRGKDCSAFTARLLNEESVQYINQEMNHLGKAECLVDGKRLLFLHGSLKDCFWDSIKTGDREEEYRNYDYVFSAHSHRPHLFEQYYPSECGRMRKRKKTVFINAGSVGQPRNHSTAAQYGIFDTFTGGMEFGCVYYDVKAEQALYTEELDEFYCTRLGLGI